MILLIREQSIYEYGSMHNQALTIKYFTIMELISRALEFEKRSMGGMSTSDRVKASREAKSLVLSINEIYKRTKEPYLMEIMKLVTEKKRKIEKRLKGRPLV